MAKILGILGSPRREGNTATLLQRTFGLLPDSVETETVSLKDYRIEPCEACHRCEADGHCILEDGMQALYPKLQAADALVLASPVYMGGLTSRMRAFMERTWPLRKGQLAGRVGTWIVVGRRKPGAAVYAMEDFLSRLGLIRLPGVFGYALHKGEILDDEEALRESDRLVGDLLARWPSPGAEAPDQDGRAGQHRQTFESRGGKE